MAIRLDQVGPWPTRNRDEVKIVWKGRRIAKLIFPSGKVVEFDIPEPAKADVQTVTPQENESGAPT